VRASKRARAQAEVRTEEKLLETTPLVRKRFRAGIMGERLGNFELLFALSGVGATRITCSCLKKVDSSARFKEDSLLRSSQYVNTIPLPLAKTASWRRCSQ